MSSKLFLGTKPGFSLSHEPNQSAKNSKLQVYHPHISSNTHLTKPTISMKISAASYRTRTKATINMYTRTDTRDNLYELLGITESVTFSEIKQAYKRLALKYHPDVSPPDCMEEYTQRFIRVQEAYHILSDPNSRALYDRAMTQGLHRGDSMNRWQSQLMDLNKRSVNKVARGDMSWAGRMRRQRM